MRELAFDSCNVGSEGLLAIARSPLARQLIALELDRNPIEDAAVFELMRSPLANLQRLSLMGTGLGGDARQWLADRFGPGLLL